MSPFKDFNSWPPYYRAMVILLSVLAFVATFRLAIEVF